jgi:hypothetical protein
VNKLVYKRKQARKRGTYILLSAQLEYKREEQEGLTYCLSRNEKGISYNRKKMYK